MRLLQLYESRFSHEEGDPRIVGYEAERLLTQYFVPLETEAGAMLGSLCLRTQPARSKQPHSRRD